MDRETSPSPGPSRRIATPPGPSSPIGTPRFTSTPIRGLDETSINRQVERILENYRENKEGALVKIIEFIFHSSGWRGNITEDVTHMEHIVQKITDEIIAQDPCQYNNWKNFRSNICQFIEQLVKTSRHSVLYDQYLIENIMSLLKFMSKSQVRAFRHTGTFAGMKLMTALVDVVMLERLDHETCECEVKLCQGQSKPVTKRLEVLFKKQQELEKNIEAIMEMLNCMFETVFKPSFSDAVTEIRGIAITELGIWMEKFPEHYLDDTYLKYIGLALHDKVGEVRLKGLRALQPLYEREAFSDKLQLFSFKYADRIESMTADKITGVAVLAVKIITAILKMHPEMLTDMDCEAVGKLVFAARRGVAKAAAEFLNVRVFRPGCDTRSSNTPLMRLLVQFYLESGMHEYGAYLVDALIDSYPMLNDWECMTGLLLEEAGAQEEQLGDHKESLLIELMMCCVRQATTGEAPAGRAASRSMTRRQSKTVRNERTKMTTHFIVTLPVLLEKFSSDPEKLANLVVIPQYFDLELYTAQRQISNLSLLLDRLSNIMLVRTEEKVLEVCSRTLEVLYTETHSASIPCKVACKTVTDKCVNLYKEAIDKYRRLVERGETPDADELSSVTIALRKVSIMHKCHDLNYTNIWDSLFQDLPKCVQENETQMPTEALKHVVNACYYSLLWFLPEIQERGRDEVLAVLGDRLHAYVEHCSAILQRGLTPDLKEQAYMSICDLLILFAEPALEGLSSAAVSRIALETNAALCDLLDSFVQTFVFVRPENDHDDTNKENLYERRNFLAALCKLFVYGRAPIHRAANILKHYHKFFEEYGDIIKMMVNKSRDVFEVDWAVAMVHAIQRLYTDIVQRHGTAHSRLPDFLEIKELSKKFARMLTGPEALAALHRAGVEFAALEPANQLFVELLSVFPKQLPQNKRKDDTPGLQNVRRQRLTIPLVERTAPTPRSACQSSSLSRPQEFSDCSTDYPSSSHSSRTFYSLESSTQYASSDSRLSFYSLVTSSSTKSYSTRFRSVVDTSSLDAISTICISSDSDDTLAE